MYCSHRTFEKHCRWCGKTYYANKPANQDGFHSQACKQAHYRAYKNYVTKKHLAADQISKSKVTRKRKGK